MRRPTTAQVSSASYHPDLHHCSTHRPLTIDRPLSKKTSWKTSWNVKGGASASGELWRFLT